MSRSPSLPRGAEVVRREGRATLSRQDGVWILNLFGTRQEMAYQHGALAREMIADSALPFFADKIHSSVRETYILKNHPHLAAVVANRVIDWIVTRSAAGPNARGRPGRR